MGGYGSGRTGGRPLKEEGKTIDLALMLRSGWMKVGCHGFSHSLIWTRNGNPAGDIRYDYDLTDPDNASMTLRFTVKRRSTGESKDYVQHVRLSYTIPHYGGRRWWMHCPLTGERVAKLYVPNGGDIFAGRKAWRLSYHIQKVPHRERPLERLFSLQQKLGCSAGVQNWPTRPKGMWQRTYDRHMVRFWQLEHQCTLEMMAMVKRLKRHG